jgi:hypothetical protein
MSLLQPAQEDYPTHIRTIAYHSLKDTNSWTIQPANFNVYMPRLVSWCDVGCDR